MFAMDKITETHNVKKIKIIILIITPRFGLYVMCLKLYQQNNLKTKCTVVK